MTLAFACYGCGGCGKAMTRSMRSKNSIRVDEIGQRLQAYRVDRGLSPEDLAGRIGISRAALYRAEKGEILKIDTLVRITDVLGVTLQSLLGIGVEYIDGAVAFFTRMGQLEAESDQIIGYFGSISYLLTSSAYDDMLQAAFDDFKATDVETKDQVESLKKVLRSRKETYLKRRPLLVSLISAADFERFLIHGLIGRRDLSPEVLGERRRMATLEARRICRLVRDPPIGVQIGIMPDTAPSSSYQLFRQAERTVLAISPYRLGERPNLRLGVGIITTSQEGVQLHEDISRQMWTQALKGQSGAAFLEDLIQRYGYAEHERAE